MTGFGRAKVRCPRNQCKTKIYRPGELLDQVKGKIGPAGPTDHADWVLHVKPLRKR